MMIFNSNTLATSAKKSSNLYLKLRENHAIEKFKLGPAINYKLTGQRKTYDLDELAPEPAIR